MTGPARALGDRLRGLPAARAVGDRQRGALRAQPALGLPPAGGREPRPGVDCPVVRRRPRPGSSRRPSAGRRPAPRAQRHGCPLDAERLPGRRRARPGRPARPDGRTSSPPGTGTTALKPDPKPTDVTNSPIHRRKTTVNATTMSTEAANFSWLLDNFVKSVPGVQHTLVVSADGLLMAMSDDLDRTGGDQMAAIVSGMSSLTRGAARQLRAGEVRQSIVEMDTIFLFSMSVNDGSVLAVVADAHLRRRPDRLRDGPAGQPHRGDPDAAARERDALAAPRRGPRACLAGRLSPWGTSRSSAAGRAADGRRGRGDLRRPAVRRHRRPHPRQRRPTLPHRGARAVAAGARARDDQRDASRSSTSPRSSSCPSPSCRRTSSSLSGSFASS